MSCHTLLYLLFLDSSDYHSLVDPFFGFASFDPGSPSNRTCFQIPIFDDNLFEKQESFNVTLDLFEVGANRIMIDQPVTEIFILDDDSKLLI